MISESEEDVDQSARPEASEASRVFRVTTRSIAREKRALKMARFCPYSKFSA